MDLFQLGNKTYLLAIDYYSKYPEIALLTNTASDTVISHVKFMVPRHGIPEQVISDNGPQFSSECFCLFAREYGFSHTTSSPRYPQSNGMAEKGVRIVKNLLTKAIASGNDPYLALLSYRSSPPACGYSPAELLMGRKIRNRIPRLSDHINVCGGGVVNTKFQNSTRSYYNKSAKEIKPLKHGDIVRIQVLE